ncbi:aspartate/glutamate racemase family protein [Rhodobacter sp. HX-7-19]|uniref:Aspartate/glutamate racemase family protein n=1 Tax=Paragemmobacter kunshanensis TaxID=2583234 RepID=A0A6M1U5W4_9RHOB|nr:amino acid racemase [Rhodobacter kunshanensis]NGQ93184.1 aspartate/glutamate racemase family protein [Rhodobacter kunshanensis]
MRRNLVGVLGGMGPEATILLQQRLLATVTARDDADHIPLLIDMNPQVPSRIAHLIEGTGTDPAPTLARMAQRLEAAGATALAMPCNTAHHYAPQIAAAVAIPLLNMVDLSVAHAAQSAPEGASIGMLASPAVQQTGVFDPALTRAGMTALWPEDTGPMLDAIRNIKAHGPTPEARQILQDTADVLAAKGAAVIFVACTEFSLLAPDLRVAVPVIDTVDVLARAIRDHSLMKSS